MSDKDLRTLREKINDQTGSTFYKIDNPDLSAVEVAGYLLAVAGIPFIGVEVLQDFRWYGWAALLTGIALLVIGGLISKRDEPKVSMWQAKYDKIDTAGSTPAGERETGPGGQGSGEQGKQ